MTSLATWSGGRATPRSSLRYLAHSGVLMPMSRRCASGVQCPPRSATRPRRTCSQTGSEAISTPARSNTTALIMGRDHVSFGSEGRGPFRLGAGTGLGEGTGDEDPGQVLAVLAAGTDVGGGAGALGGVRGGVGGRGPVRPGRPGRGGGERVAGSRPC